EPHRVSPSGGAAPQAEAAPTTHINGGRGGNVSSAAERDTPHAEGSNSSSTPATAGSGDRPNGRQGDNGAAGNSQPPALSNGQRVVDFVCEDDVRSALQKGEKIYVNARTIITPAARDMGDAAEVFAKG
nr:hypothetical protein [Pyrinomonadaceae bacterium]